MKRPRWRQKNTSSNKSWRFLLDDDRSTRRNIPDVGVTISSIMPLCLHSIYFQVFESTYTALIKSASRFWDMNRMSEVSRNSWRLKYARFSQSSVRTEILNNPSQNTQRILEVTQNTRGSVVLCCLTDTLNKEPARRVIQSPTSRDCSKAHCWIEIEI